MARIKNKVLDRVKELKTIATTFYDMNQMVRVVGLGKSYVGKILHVNDVYIYLEVKSRSEEKVKVKIDFTEIDYITIFDK